MQEEDPPVRRTDYATGRVRALPAMGSGHAEANGRRAMTYAIGVAMAILCTICFPAAGFAAPLIDDRGEADAGPIWDFFPGVVCLKVNLYALWEHRNYCPEGCDQRVPQVITENAVEFCGPYYPCDDPLFDAHCISPYVCYECNGPCGCFVQALYDGETVFIFLQDPDGVIAALVSVFTMIGPRFFRSIPPGICVSRDVT